MHYDSALPWDHGVIVRVANGAVYLSVALLWLWVVDGVTPGWTDLVGVGLALSGAAVIAAGHRGG